MKLWILYNGSIFKTSSLSPKFMLEAAQRSGVDAEIYYKDEFFVAIENNIQTLYYGNTKVKELPDVVFCRGYNDVLLSYFEKNGCIVINSAKGMNTAIDKYKTHQMVASLKIVAQPKTLFGTFEFNALVKILGLPFVMKDNFGGRGEKVYLVNNKVEYSEIVENSPKLSFIYQKYISTSKGKDLRCYVVGDKVFPIKRVAESSSEFRSNISQGGHAEVYEITKEHESKVLKIAKLLGLEIGSVDFLFGKDGQLVFCEANGNAAFKAYTDLKIYLRDEFFGYISKKYATYKNFINQKIKLTKLNNSFEVLKGKGKVMLSAPHNVMQIRDLKLKFVDLGTGHLLLNVHNLTGSHAIIKTNCMGKVNELDDDANYTANHPYKLKIKDYVKENKVKYLMDIHSMAKSRPEIVNFGINGGQNIQQKFEVLKSVETIFNSHGYLVTTDIPFKAGEGTISNYVAKESNIFTLQIEINSKLIDLKNESNEFNKMSACLNEVVNYLNKH